MPRLSELSVGLNVAGFSVQGKWQPDEAERKAAWEMYVELVTRVSLMERAQGEGSIREALTSLYSLFDSTREILRRYGPAVARPKGDGKLSFAYLAVTILNQALRPFVSDWHARLSKHEAQLPPGAPLVLHEAPLRAEFEAGLNALRGTLQTYAELLAEAAGIPNLTMPTA